MHIPKLLTNYKNAIFLGVIIAIALVYALHNRFIQDDAFISFRYAKNFADGYGLVWYPNSIEFGYTSFLFTFLVGILIKLSINVPFAAYIISFPAYIGALLGTYFLGRLVTQSSLLAKLSVLALGIHLTFSSYATSGLETSLQAFFVIWSYYCGISWDDSNRSNKLFALGLCALFAMLTRLDSLLLLIPIYVYITINIYKKFHAYPNLFYSAIRSFLSATILPVSGVCALLLGCYIYYGYALPNTFYVKIDNIWHYDTGITYLYNYLQTQGYIPLLLIFFWIWQLIDKKRMSIGRSFLLGSPIFIWLLYIIHIGGDFMEYRLLVPILPFFFLLILSSALGKSRHPDIGKTLLVFVAIVISAFIHKKFYEDSRDSPDKFQVVAFKQLQKPMIQQPNSWISVGKQLNKLFYSGNKNDVKIATTAAGALPFYSGLPTIDQLGINTRADYQSKVKFLNYPAHRQRLREDFLIKERVNIVIDHPLYHYKHPLRCGDAPNVSFHTPMRSVPMIFIPVNKNYFLLAYYLTVHPKIEQLITQRQILRCL